MHDATINNVINRCSIVQALVRFLTIVGRSDDVALLVAIPLFRRDSASRGGMSGWESGRVERSALSGRRRLHARCARSRYCNAIHESARARAAVCKADTDTVSAFCLFSLPSLPFFLFSLHVDATRDRSIDVSR